MSTISGEFMKTFEKEWINVDTKLSQIPGKVFISTLSTYSQEHYNKAITINQIIDAMKKAEIPNSMRLKLQALNQFFEINSN
jgi:hypothetical protein